MNLTDKQYVELFDEFRLKTTTTASDTQLKHWGYSNEDIIKIKIRTIKEVLELQKIGIQIGTYIHKHFGKNVL